MNRSRTVALATIGCVALAGTTGAVTTASADADRSTDIEGTWTVTVAPNPGPQPFESTLTFADGGSLVEATSRGPMSAGIGAWAPVGRDKVQLSFVKYRFDASGAYIGKVTVHEVATVAPDGQSYHGQATTVVTDPAGHPVATFGSVSQGHRVSP